MFCEKCKKEFFIDWRIDLETRKTPCKFCSRSCANSKVHTEETKIKIAKKLQVRIRGNCIICHKPVHGYGSKYCIFCYKDMVEERFLLKTLGEVIKKEYKRRHVYQSIRNNARVLMNRWGIKKKCFCGYDKHVEICHKKPIPSFSHNTLIKEINDKDNLIYLCPNHHWEFDNAGLDHLVDREFSKLQVEGS